MEGREEKSQAGRLALLPMDSWRGDLGSEAWLVNPQSGWGGQGSEAWLDNPHSGWTLESNASGVMEAGLGPEVDYLKVSWRLGWVLKAPGRGRKKTQTLRCLVLA